MPTSDFKYIPTITSIIEKECPKRVLDIGFGRGKYGLLTRELHPEIEKLVGVEAYEPYITNIQTAIYDLISIGDICDLNTRYEFFDFDLVLMIDVIEHIEKQSGLSLLRDLVKSNKKILISTPRGWMQQQHEIGWEVHKSLWENSDLKEFEVVEDKSTDQQLIVLIKQK